MVGITVSFFSYNVFIRKKFIFLEKTIDIYVKIQYNIIADVKKHKIHGAIAKW